MTAPATEPEQGQPGAEPEPTPDPERVSRRFEQLRTQLDHRVARIRAWRPDLPERRLHRLAVVGLVLAIVVVGVFGVSYRQARARLADRRAELDQATVQLAGLRGDLDQVLADHAVAAGELATTRSAITTAVDTRTYLEAVAANTQTDIAAVGANQAQVDTARMETAANSNEAQACLDGVSQAVNASRRGDDMASIGALRGASNHCAHTLAYATGARFPYDFADPFVLRVGGTYYGYSTNSGAGDIQVLRSADMVAWELVGNALAGLPAWASSNATWAPAVLARDGRYVAYYTVREAATQRQCISRAVASSPVGPFHDDSSGPLICEFGGSIDPSPFVDHDGRAYLLWKSEGVPWAAPGLWSQELTSDGLALAGQPTQLLTVDRSFERGVVEAPSLVHEGGIYFLVYAGADWNSRSYTTAYATCSGPTGPCQKPGDGRVLRSGSVLAGPGGAEVFRARDGTLWAAFHAFSEPNVGYPSSRYLHVARVRVADGRLVVDAST